MYIILLKWKLEVVLIIYMYIYIQLYTKYWWCYIIKIPYHTSLPGYRPINKHRCNLLLTYRNEEALRSSPNKAHCIENTVMCLIYYDSILFDLHVYKHNRMNIRTVNVFKSFRMFSSPSISKSNVKLILAKFLPFSIIR